MRAAARALRVVAAAAVLAAATATPAAAHVIGAGARPTNYRTTVRGIEPAVPGLRARIVAAGDRLELVNGTGKEVLVLGYRLEPYLRVGPDGAFENRRSPSAYANRFATAPASVPRELDPAAAPQWRRIGARPTVAWHDHRAHWSGPDPQAVTADRGRRHLVSSWQVPLRMDGRTLLLEGDVTWVPGPSPWPWALAAVAVFALAMAAGRGARRPQVFALVALLAVAADAVHTVGALLASSAPLSAELNGTATTVAGWVVAGLAAYRLLRGRAEGAAVFLLLGGVLLTLAGALPDLAALGRSQLPTAVGPTVTRAAIAATLGFGAAMVAAGLLGFRLERPEGSGEPGGPGGFGGPQGGPPTGRAPLDRVPPDPR